MQCMQCWKRLHALAAKRRRTGLRHTCRKTSADDGATTRSRDDWLDRDFLKTYAQEADDSVSLEAVRQAMAKIPGRLVDDIRAERDER